jgi:hypothetical protein
MLLRVLLLVAMVLAIDATVGVLLAPLRVTAFAETLIGMAVVVFAIATMGKRADCGGAKSCGSEGRA